MTISGVKQAKVFRTFQVKTAMRPDLLVCSVSLILLTSFIVSPVESETPLPVEDVYVGCYKMVDPINTPPKDIKLKYWLWDRGIELCHHIHNTTYVGVKTVFSEYYKRTNKIDVFCVNTLESQYKQNDSSCKPCKSYIDKICGGSTSISVYEIKVQEATKEDSNTTNEKTHLTETTTTVAAETTATVPSDEKTAPVQEASKEDSTSINDKTHLTETTTTVAAETTATVPSDEKTAPVQEATKEDSNTTNEKTHLTETTTTVAAETTATVPSDEKTAPVQEATKEDSNTTNEKTHITETTTTVIDVSKRTVSSEGKESGLGSETTSDTLVIENETTTPRDHKNETFNGKIPMIFYPGMENDATNEPNYNRPVQVNETTNLTENENAHTILYMIRNSPYFSAPISVVGLACVGLLVLLVVVILSSYCLCKPDRASIDREAFKIGLGNNRW